MIIYFKKENGAFVGSGAIDKIKAGSSEIEPKEFANWLTFRKANPNKDYYVLNGELVAIDFIKSFEEQQTAKYAELKSVRDVYKKANGYDNDRTNDNIARMYNGYTQTDADNLTSFMDDLIAKYDAMKLSITNAMSETELNNINITFED